MHWIASAQDCLVLDEELNTLSAKYREVLVMNYFAGQSCQEIADQLSVSTGTIDGRIREARNALRVRLARRGVAIGVLAVAAGLGSGTAAAASSAILNSTIQLGAQLLSGSVPGTIDLSQLETTMFTSKLIVTSLLCIATAAGLLGMTGLLQEVAGDNVAKASQLDPIVTDDKQGGRSAAAEGVAVRLVGASLVVS